MPISREQFDQGKTPASWEQAILTFLNTHPSEAYGTLEVARAIQYPLGSITGAHSLQAILHRLANQGKIEERVVRTGRRAETFYATMG